MHQLDTYSFRNNATLENQSEISGRKVIRTGKKKQYISYYSKTNEAFLRPESKTSPIRLCTVYSVGLYVYVICTNLVLSFCNVPNSMLHVMVSQKCCDDMSCVTIKRNRNGELDKYLRPLRKDASAFNNLDIICCSGCGPLVIVSHFMRPRSAFDLHRSSMSCFRIMTTVSVLLSDLVNLFNTFLLQIRHVRVIFFFLFIYAIVSIDGVNIQDGRLLNDSKFDSNWLTPRTS